ncbi:MAG: ATP-dependent sacrificial sulfur transferase LarE [Oligoflexia bacterium]|nr:ATP-dependent sacrificial sulfur transferase LarE [Oligoflexia bacterium]
MALIVAIVTPSQDPFTLIILLIPIYVGIEIVFLLLRHSPLGLNKPAIQKIGSETQKKLDRLHEVIYRYQSVAIAYSGGVDSTLLCHLCFDILKDNALAITVVSPLVAQNEINDAKEYARAIGIKHHFLSIPTLIPEIRTNPKDRCYHCKKHIFSQIIKYAKANANAKATLGKTYTTTIFDGQNLDDLQDYRPGMRAVQELGVTSPLILAELNKNDIRQLSHHLGLKSWNKPACACLASRIPYTEEITEDKLHLIATAEECLRQYGFNDFRIRTHQLSSPSNLMARIELSPKEMESIFINFTQKQRDQISQKLKTLGFIFVTVELSGYQMGSLNWQIK